MLAFFRRYQTYFFAIISVVIIISFSFFGTYSTLPANAIHEQVAFKAIDGTEVSRGELDELVLFIGTDNDDKRLFGGMWGPNFLNDGVINRDLLQTGLAEILVAAYPEQVERDLQLHLEKEKRFILYSHPSAKFVGTEGAWNYFAPDMKKNFDILRNSQIAVDKDAFAARVALFLDERKFPAPMLRQVLRYQQKQYSWLSPDPNLEHIDLSLFGYHTAEDWFGSRVLRLMGEFIINSSKLAEQKGYQVSKEEALAELLRNSEISYQQNVRNPHLGVANSSEYFNEQLRRLGMDQTKAVKVWRQVLLFRRLFQDVGNAVVVDPLSQKQFAAYAKETASGDMYSLPQELQLSDYRALQKLEIYLDAVAKRSDNDRLMLPSSFLAVAEVKRKYPELVQKQYLLQLSQTQKKSLQTKVGLKEMWNWEVDDKNWPTLKKEFPELGIQPGNTRDERFAALDSLEDVTRGRVDNFARTAIVDAHPEWLQEALEAAEPRSTVVGLSPSGGRPIYGLDDRKELIRLLDEAAESKEAAQKLSQFTNDQNNYYRITVLERAPQEEIMTFAEANRSGTLDTLLDRQLEAYYMKIRGSNPNEFQKDDKSWKELSEVKNAVADRYFEKLLTTIRKDYANATGNQGQQPTTGDLAASVRLYAYVNNLQKKLQAGNPDALAWVQAPKEKVANDRLTERAPLADQWKLDKADYEVNHIESKDEIDRTEIFALPLEGWTSVHAPVNGDLYFFQLKTKNSANDPEVLMEKVLLAQEVLSDDAQRTYTHRVIDELKAKHAISLEYLDRATEMLPEETPATDNTAETVQQ